MAGQLLLHPGGGELSGYYKVCPAILLAFSRFPGIPAGSSSGSLLTHPCQSLPFTSSQALITSYSSQTSCRGSIWLGNSYCTQGGGELSGYYKASGGLIKPL